MRRDVPPGFRERAPIACFTAPFGPGMTGVNAPPASAARCLRRDGGHSHPRLLFGFLRERPPARCRWRSRGSRADAPRAPGRPPPPSRRPIDRGSCRRRPYPNAGTAPRRRTEDGREFRRECRRGSSPGSSGGFLAAPTASAPRRPAPATASSRSKSPYSLPSDPSSVPSFAGGGSAKRGAADVVADGAASHTSSASARRPPR